MGADVIIQFNVGTPLACESELTSAVGVAQQMLNILTVAGMATKQDGRAGGFYAVGTACSNPSESFGVYGHAGVSFAKVTGTNLLSAIGNLMGSKSSLLVGLRADFRYCPP